MIEGSRRRPWTGSAQQHLIGIEVDNLTIIVGLLEEQWTLIDQVGTLVDDSLGFAVGHDGFVDDAGDHALLDSLHHTLAHSVSMLSVRSAELPLHLDFIAELP